MSRVRVSSDEYVPTRSRILLKADPDLSAASATSLALREEEPDGVNQTPRYLYSLTTSSFFSPTRSVVHSAADLLCGRP